jgi:thiol:disulfide interchange protein DsbD
VAVKLGYKNVYRDPKGYPAWHAKGLPSDSSPAGLSQLSPEPQNSKTFKGWAMIWTLLGIFAGGIALNLTPCVYPLIPITVSYFGGQSTQSQGKLVMHGACYIGGLSITNSVLGVFAALTGGLLGNLLQHPVVLATVAAVLILFSTSLFGFWELRLPYGMTQLASKTYSGYFGSLFMGLTLGVVASACIGPFILGILTWVAGMGSVWKGVKPRIGLTTLFPGPVFRTIGKTAPFRGVDAVGEKAFGLGSGRYGRLFYSTPVAQDRRYIYISRRRSGSRNTSWLD